uniref:OB domain-containing protein n=1 Tax=Stegastes partitus TaxID=144197 RepID=A0A3B5ATZ6_9TELE
MHSFTLILPQKASLLPTTVSQLLSASQISNETFALCDLELNQVSVVGIIRGFAPFVTNIQYSVDDMTGPPLKVMQWVNTKDCALMTSVPTGTYVKVTGNLLNFNVSNCKCKVLLAKDIRCIKDLNEITSHMLEVVHAHMLLFGKVKEQCHRNVPAHVNFVKRSTHTSVSHCKIISILVSHYYTINVHNFRRRPTHITVCHILVICLITEVCNMLLSLFRTSLAVLINEGHVFCTVDEHHFKSAVG